MSWDQFVQVAVTVIYWTLIWLLVAIPAAVLIYAVGRFVPNAPVEAANRILAFRPGPSEAGNHFKQSKAEARQRLSLGTVRILLDRKHTVLKKELAQIRATLDRRLQQITRASKSTTGTTLMDLLVNFREDAAKATSFDAIDDVTLEKSVALSKARSKFRLFAFSILVVSLVNFGLLYLYFDETFGGLTIPYVGIEIAVIGAAFFPLVESLGGLVAESIKEKDDSPLAKFFKGAMSVCMIFPLAALEYYIFYKLFEGGFKGQIDFPEGGAFHMTIALVGPAITLFQASSGYGVARELDRIKELGTVQSIKEQVAGAKRFVDGLEGRYDRIEEAAARAAESVDEFAAQIKGRGEAEQPAVSLLGDERKRFIEAVDSVNPTRWKREVAPSEGDIAAVTSYAIFLPLGVIVVLGMFALVFAPALQESGLFAVSHNLAVGLSLLTGLVALLAGGALFDRTSTAVEHDASWKDVLSPRDGAFKAFSLFGLGAIAIGIVWVCIAAHGIVGVAEALLLVGIIAGICWASSYIDLMLRGMAYLGATSVAAVIWLVRMLGRLAWLASIFALTAVAATVLFVLHVTAWPITWVKSQIWREPSGNHLQASAA
nr:hypothetical protein [uncultured Sphingomonas sp.]